MYETVKKHPIAKFYYKGSHTHHIRRTVILTEVNRYFIRGYEIREGFITREPHEDFIRTYRLNRIPVYGDYSRLRFSKINKRKRKGDTTLRRMSRRQLQKEGV